MRICELFPNPIAGSAHGPEHGEAEDEDGENDGGTYDYLGAELDTLVVFGIEVPHQSCGGGETFSFFFCHWMPIPSTI